MLFSGIQMFGQLSRNIVITSGNNVPFRVYVNKGLINNAPLKEVRITGLTADYYDITVQFATRGTPTVTSSLYAAPLSEIVYEVYPPDNRNPEGTIYIQDIYPLNEKIPQFQPGTVFVFGTTGRAMPPQGGNIQSGQININITNNNTPVNPPGGVVPGYTGTIGCQPPVTPDRYESMLQAVISKDFDEAKLRVAKQIIRQNSCLTVSQLMGILRLFDFDKDKLELAKLAYHYIYDIENFYKVNNVFDFENSVEELDKYISDY